jgi:hypothetical protein
MALLTQTPRALSGKVMLDSLGPEDSQPKLPALLKVHVLLLVTTTFSPPTRQRQPTSPPQGDSNRHPPSHSTPHTASGTGLEIDRPEIKPQSQHDSFVE